MSYGFIPTQILLTSLTVVVHPRKVVYSRDPAFDRMFPLPGNPLRTLEAVISGFYFVQKQSDFPLIPMALGRTRRMYSHHHGRPVNFSTLARAPIKKFTRSLFHYIVPDSRANIECFHTKTFHILTGSQVTGSSSALPTIRVTKIPRPRCL